MSISEFDQLIAGDKPVLVDFYADWCEPCQWLEPILVQVDEMVEGRASTFKIDIDQFPDLREKYSIMSVPVLIIFKNNEIRWRMNGFTNANELSRQLITYV